MEMTVKGDIAVPRQVRAASAVAADLMKSLKPRKKGPIDKGKSKISKSGPPVSEGWSVSSRTCCFNCSSITYLITVDSKQFLFSAIYGYNDAGVFYNVSSGPLFTWSNHQSENPIAKKLDGVLINEVWLAEFPHSTADFLPPGISDHCPTVIELSQVTLW
ncbi:hypothetical protein DITRI_Ditri18aG0008900 [Diplodiscus trichospermus]